jgi:hypothetical protein
MMPRVCGQVNAGEEVFQGGPKTGLCVFRMAEGVVNELA